MASITSRYIVAQKIARKAGELAHDFFIRRRSLAIEAKGAQNYVTQADRTVEQLIFDELRREFPSDALLGEESASSFTASKYQLSFHHGSVPGEWGCSSRASGAGIHGEDAAPRRARDHPALCCGAQRSTSG